MFGPLVPEVAAFQIKMVSLAVVCRLRSRRHADKMWTQRFYDYDLRSYPRGYYFNFLGLVRILKFKANTVMQKEDWIFIIEIFGCEFVIR